MQLDYRLIMPFPDPFNDHDQPAWKQRAEAVEYWIVGGLLVGAWVYGIYCGIRGLIG